MILARFSTLDGPRFGLVEGAVVRELRRSPFDGPVEAWGSPLAVADVHVLARLANPVVDRSG